VIDRFGAGEALVASFTISNEDPLVLEQDNAPSWRRRARIPKDRYFSRERAERERAWIDAGWLLVGSTLQLEQPGDFLTIQIVDQPVLVVRQADRSIRAFHNVCSHRGRRLVDDAAGSAQRFRCTYHEWTYSLEGQLRGVPHGRTFADLDRAACGLKQVRVAEWNRLVFVNMDGSAEPLADYLGPIRDCLDGWFDAARLLSSRGLEQSYNWKLLLDNFYEFYHLDGLHPQRTGKLVPEHGAFVLFERHALQVNPYASERAWSPSRRWQDWLDVPRTRACGYSFHMSLFPNQSVHINPEFGGTSFIQALPHPTDPERSTVNLWSFSLDDGEMDMSIREQGAQDFANGPPHVAGLRSRAFREQIMSAYECRVSHFHAALDEFLDRQDAAEERRSS
jgi:phenylpropionate dioxygenase-like ring-hydroxylating dioxygenase large terminal subunit